MCDDGAEELGSSACENLEFLSIRAQFSAIGASEADKSGLIRFDNNRIPPGYESQTTSETFVPTFPDVFASAALGPAHVRNTHHAPARNRTSAIVTPVRTLRRRLSTRRL